MRSNADPRGRHGPGDASNWCPVSPHPASPARVVLLCGPSGSGKSLVAARSGLPVLRLDDFYKDGDDPTLPLVPGSSDIDWDAPGSWDEDAAVAAVAELCAHGRTTVPVYDIALSARTGTEELSVGRTPLFVAEGVFAAEIVSRCRELGLRGGAVPDPGPGEDVPAALPARSARGPQVGAVPAAPRLAADARRSARSSPVRPAWAPTPATVTRP